MSLRSTIQRSILFLVLGAMSPGVGFGDEPKTNPFWKAFPDQKLDKQIAACRYELRGRGALVSSDETGVFGPRQFILWERRIPVPNSHWALPSLLVVTDCCGWNTPPEVRDRVRENVVWNALAYRPYSTLSFEDWHWDIAYHRERKRAYLVRLACDRHNEIAKVSIFEVFRKARVNIDTIVYDAAKSPDKQDLPAAKPLSDREVKIPKNKHTDDVTKPTFVSVRVICKEYALGIFLIRSDTAGPVELEFSLLNRKWRETKPK